MQWEWNGDSVRSNLEAKSAEALLRAAVFFQAQHMHRLNIPNPSPHLNPSKPGEYPKKRTGVLQGSVLFEPTDPGEVARLRTIRVGLANNAFYGNVLALNYDRKGLLDTLEELRPQLQSLLEDG